MSGSSPRRRPRSVWNTAPGVQPADEALLAEWHELHPVKPWRGEDGRGGFVGWANRLDERVAQRGHLMSPRSEVIPVPQREVYRELLRMLKSWRVLAALLAGLVVALAVSPPLGLPAVAALLTMAAGARVRARRRGEMRSELAALGDAKNAPSTVDS